MKHLPTLTAALIASVAVNAQTLQKSDVSPRYQLEALGMSSNHRYICGLNVSTYCAFIWDTELNTVVENKGEYANCDFRNITDDGHAYGILGLDDMVTTNASVFDTEGNVSTIDNEMSQIFDVTPDGRIAVGCMLDEMWLPTACLWKDGQRIILPCPNDTECGFDNDGANAQFVSADGSVIAGYLQDWHSSRPAIIWRLQADGSYAYDIISKDIWELNFGDGKTYLQFEPLGISDNGKWLCLAGQKEAEGWMPTPEFMIRMNLETGEIQEMGKPNIEYFEPSTDGIYPSAIADDGTCIGSATDATGFQRGVIWKSGTDSPELLANVFPSLKELEDYDGFMHLPIAISADAQHIAGYACPVTWYADGPDYDFVSYLLSDDSASGIKTIHHDSSSLAGKSQKDIIYTLSGRRASTNARGIVISEGRKVVK